MKLHGSDSRSLTIRKVLLIMGIIFIAFNMRSAITAVGPLIGEIRKDLMISNGVAGILTTLPLISFGVFSILAPKFGARYGNERTLFAGLVVLMVGVLLRSAGMTVALFVGTALIGVGIAICNVLLPSLVKQKYPTKIGLMTSMYSTAMNIFAALASGISIPLAVGLGLGWEMSLMTWSVLAFVAILIWIPQLRQNGRPQHSKQPSAKGNKSIWSSTIAWQVTLFMGLQSFLFYSVIAWMPEILRSYGMSVSMAGWMLSITQFCGLPATFLAPVLAEKFRNQKGLVAVIGVLYGIGISGLFFGGNIIVLSISVVLIGIGQGACISLALALIGLRSVNAYQAAALSGMAQSIGYLLAATGPILIGSLFDHTDSWTLSIILLLIVLVITVVAGIGAGRNRFVLEPTQVEVEAGTYSHTNA